MVHLRLLLSQSRRHPQPHRLLPLFHFSADANSSSAPPPPPIDPVSYAPKPQPPPDEAAATPAHAEFPEAGPGARPPLPRRPQQLMPPRQWTREEVRFVKDSAPAISPVSYPSKVAPLPEDWPAGGEAEAEEGLRGEGERIEMDAARVSRSIFGMPVEEEQVPYPTLIPVVKRPQKVAIDLVDAIRQVKASANEKKRNFIETVEAHVMLGVDPRRGDQMVRGAITLPHGTGKTVRVAVFAEGPAADEAKAAGADIVGGDELIEEIRTGGGKLSFDKCIATPMFMPRLSKVARILGPRGLMPNPKLGSVTNDVSGAVKAAKSGRVDFKIDKTAIVHVGLGKVHFPEESLRENIGAFVHALLLAKPVGLKKSKWRTNPAYTSGFEYLTSKCYSRSMDSKRMIAMLFLCLSFSANADEAASSFDPSLSATIEIFFFLAVISPITIPLY